MSAKEKNGIVAPQETLPTRQAIKQEFARSHRQIIDRMDFTETLMALIFQPEDTLSDMAPEMMASYSQHIYQAAIKHLAEETHVDPAILSDEKRRTPEQTQQLLRVCTEAQAIRFHRFLSSNWVWAHAFLLKETKTPLEISALAESALRDGLCTDKEPLEIQAAAASLRQEPLIHAAVLYFFALHTSLDEGASAKSDQRLTADNEQELLSILDRMRRFAPYPEGDVEAETAFLYGFIDHEHPPQQARALESLIAKTPAFHVIPNNKLSNLLTRLDLIDGGLFSMQVSRKDAPRQVETTCMLTFEGEDVKLTGHQPLTEFDRNVYNAVTSLFVYGNESHIMTAAMIFRAMEGLTGSEKPTPQQTDAVKRSMDKMRFIRCRINCKKELQARKISLNGQQITDGEIDTYLLMAESVRVSAGGQEVTAYKVMRVPVLYEYSQAVRQVITVPLSLLDIKKLDSKGRITTKSIGYTERRVAIRGYLIRRIESMKNEKNNIQSNTISLKGYERNGVAHTGLYAIAGTPTPTKKQAMDIRADVKSMLDYWKATGFIRSYEAYRDDHSTAIAGFRIDV